MSINKITSSPLALREGFHVVLLRALAERLQGRDWVLKGETNLRLYFGSIRFSEDIDLDMGKDVGGAPCNAPFRRRWLTEMCNGVGKPAAYSRPR
jgi:hypothetical protein